MRRRPVPRLRPLEDLDVGAPAGVEVEAEGTPVAQELELHRQAEDVGPEGPRLREVAREDADVRHLLDPDRHGFALLQRVR